MREEQDLMVLEEGHSVEAMQGCCAAGVASAKIR